MEPDSVVEWLRLGVDTGCIRIDLLRSRAILHGEEKVGYIVKYYSETSLNIKMIKSTRDSITMVWLFGPALIKIVLHLISQRGKGCVKGTEFNKLHEIYNLSFFQFVSRRIVLHNQSFSDLIKYGRKGIRL